MNRLVCDLLELARTGYGLAIVREIAEAHDWTVDATTGDGGGARFEFRTAQ